MHSFAMCDGKLCRFWRNKISLCITIWQSPFNEASVVSRRFRRKHLSCPRPWIVSPHDAVDPTHGSLRGAEEHASRARRIGMDDQSELSGGDKCVPPRVNAKVGKLFDHHAASRSPKGPWSRLSQRVFIPKMELFIVSRKGCDNHECSQSPPCCRHRW